MNATPLQDIQRRMHELMRDEGSEHRALRIRILEVASQHFARFGYRKANIGEMARDVGIGKGSIYLHFESKKTLLIAAITREKMALMEPFAALLQLPPADRLRAYLELSLTFVLTSELTARLLRQDPEFVRIAAEFGADNPDDVEQAMAMLDSLIRPRCPTLDDAAIRAHSITLRAVVTAVAHLDRSTLEGMSLEHFVQNYANVLVDGVRS